MHRSGEQTLVTLRVIKAAQRLGFTLNEITDLIKTGRRAHRDAGLQARAATKLADVELRIADLNAIRSDLLAAIDAGCDDPRECAGNASCPIPFVNSDGQLLTAFWHGGHHQHALSDGEERRLDDDDRAHQLGRTPLRGAAGMPERGSPMNIEVRDVPDRQRFEAHRDGELVGFAAYQKTDTLVVFTHTEVEPSVEGQGVGGALVRHALDAVRRLDLRVLAVCPFVQAWMKRHPEYADLDYRAPTSKVTD